MRLLVPVLLLTGCLLGPDDRTSFYDRDADGIAWPEDCDDGDATLGAASTFYRDADGDGFGGVDAQQACVAPEGFVAATGDCNDTRPSVNPQALEFCNGLDDDCDALTDRDDPDASDAIVWYLDRDADEHGDAEVTTTGCEQPFGYVLLDDDCDDHEARVHPEHPEICDDIDNDCNGAIDEADPNFDPDVTWYRDGDDDSYGDSAETRVQCEPPGDDWVTRGGDCDDDDKAIRPLARERCDGIDNDCDGYVDQDDPDATNLLLWYGDADGDGFGDPDDRRQSCTIPEGTVDNNGDCDDADEGVNPDAIEVCDGVDGDCNGLVDDDAADATDWHPDADDDGYGDPAVQVTQCDPPADHVANAGDCDDTDAGVNPESWWFADDDADGYGDAASGVQACEPPTGHVADATDCDDADPDVNPATVWHRDADGDGFGSASVTLTQCATPSGYVLDGSDCDDATAATFPGADETCNGVDDDCDTDVDEDAVDAATWYTDADKDGHGDASSSTVACDRPSGTAALADDCDDADPLVRPGATEQCNGADDDCDAAVDEDVAYRDWWPDADGDGYGDTGATATNDCSAPSGHVDNANDCDDGDPAVNPVAVEVCNSADDDCDGDVDETGTTRFWRDADGDGHGSTTTSTLACSAPSGYVAATGDCDDADPDAFPGGTEVCDGVDQDCDGTSDDGVTTTFWWDGDGDGYGQGTLDVEACSAPSGYAAVTGDCDDTRASVNPAATELCNGRDDDCDATTDEADAADALTWYRDADADGYGTSATSTRACTQPTGHVATATDCDDGAAAVNPGATESCNGIDDDCDTVIDDGVVYRDWWPDDDADGYGDDAAAATNDCAAPTGHVANNDDCDDTDSAVKPGATETCDGEDDDCDGAVDEDLTSTFYRDADGDGYGTAATPTTACTAPSGYVADATDCDDAKAGVHPGATETCDLEDDDCDGEVDEDVLITYWRDADGDGYGLASSPTSACTLPSGYAAVSGDCDDGAAGVNPGATETCDGEDDDCDGTVDEGLLTTYYLDGDTDGYGRTASTTEACSLPSGYAAVGGDCADADAAVNPGATEVCNGKDDDCDGSTDPATSSGASTWYTDGDGDGYGTGSGSPACSQPSGTAAVAGDCDDGNANRYPGAVEQCNGVDDDCDTVVDDGVTYVNWYTDGDGDGYGATSSSPVNDCAAPTGRVANNTDCDDGNAAIRPGAVETCNGADDDCDTTVDEGVKTTFYRDADADGYGTTATTQDACSAPSGYVADSTDCDDTDATIKPGGTETCNGKDDDCDTTVDEGVKLTFYRDADADGYGTTTPTTQACTAPSGYAATSTDCNDGKADVHPGATETCDLEDDDCDGTVDEGVKTTFYRDADGDLYGTTATTTAACTAPSGYVANSTDCNDGNAAVNPGATEVCNAIDDDCDTSIDEGVKTTYYRDVDNDTYGVSTTTTQACSKPAGYALVAGDCDDGAVAVNPGATEVCNGVDDDCDTTVDEGVKTTFYRDADGDGYGTTTPTTQACTAPSGYAATSTDCNDGSAAVNPGATEACNGVDDDCDTSVDEAGATGESTWYRDADGDTYGTSATTQTACDQPSGYVANSSDCDDGNAAIKPGATEACNGVDDDCDTSIDEGVKTTYYYDGDLDGFGVASPTTQACTKPSGYAATSDDCDDAKNDVYPGATETCDGEDDDCDSLIDEGVKTTWYRDADVDGYGTSGSTQSACTQPSGYVATAGDCNDSVASINPGAAEICDPSDVDEDCDGLADDDDPEGATGTGDWHQDNDLDGYGWATGPSVPACDKPGAAFTLDDTDCNDSVASIHPGAAEVCNGADDDCDTVIDEAQTLQVPSDYGTVQEAVDAACDGWTVQIAAGTYAENVDATGVAVHIAGAGPSTLIDGAGSGSVVRMDAGSLRDVALQDGSAPEGGCLWVSASSFTLSNVSMEGCVATGDGGGVYLVGDGFSVDGLTITNGRATSGQGGGAFVALVESGLSNVTITGSSADFGGGIAVQAADGLTLSALTVDSSTATSDGGGVYVTDATSLAIEQLVLTGNSAGNGGGVAFGAGGGTVSITEGEFAANSATTAGGAVHASGTTATITLAGPLNIHENHAGADGAGIWATDVTTLDLVDVTLMMNHAPAGDGGHAWLKDTGGTWTGITMQGADANRYAALYAIQGQPRAFELEDARIEANISTAGGETVHVRGLAAPITLSDVEMTGNAGTPAVYAQEEFVGRNLLVFADGGGVELVTTLPTATMSLDHATIVDVAGDGVATTAIAAGQITLDHVLVVDNAGWGLANAGPFDPVVGSSAEWGNVAGSDTGFTAPPVPPAYVTMNPLFVSYATTLSSGLWDLHLGPGSPLRNADPTTFDPDGSPADIGHYGGSAAPGWSYYDDTDADGMYDGYETLHGLVVGTDDSGDDPDGDGITSYDEFASVGSHPDLADTDGDGHDDGAEHPTWDPLDPASHP